MNPLTNVRNVQKLNEQELQLGLIGKKSWHDEYKDSAWLFIGGLPYDLSEGDIICVFSQYGEIVNLNLVRCHKTGKSKGFGFLCFEDQRSTVLSVDNLNGIKILGRTIRVDHVQEYKIPKEHKNDDEFVVKMREEGCAPTIQPSSESEEEKLFKEFEKINKDKKKTKKKKKKKKKESTSSSNESDSDRPKIKEEVEVKQERHDKGYDKALVSSSHHRDKGRDTVMSGHRGRDDRDTKDFDRKRWKDEDDVKKEKRVKLEKDAYSQSDRDHDRRRDRDIGREEQKYRDSHRNSDRDSHRFRESDRDLHRSRNSERGRSTGDSYRNRDKGGESYRKRERSRSRSRSRDRKR